MGYTDEQIERMQTERDATADTFMREFDRV
jgi:hypothetical protein